MKSGRLEQITSDPPTKDKSKKGHKAAQEISVRNKAARGLSCRKSGAAVRKVSKQRRKTTGNDNGSYTPLHPQSPVMTSINSQNMPLEVPTPLRVQSPLQIQKFQLQLFPMDETTRKRLEEENHCPYLELTITSKKKIASVIRHLNMKWGNSRSALEELFLYPYNACVESLESYNRWTLKESEITAAEVHAAIGEPAVFRLRYGWLRIIEPKISNLSRTYRNFSDQLISKEIQKKDADDQAKEPSTGLSQKCDPLPAESLLKTIQAADNLRPDNDAKLSWVDCISNMSFGALLSEAEAAEAAELSCQVPRKPIASSCDSFDASIAAHIVRYRAGNQSNTIALQSILDAEETCNPFSFHKLTSANKNIPVQSQVTPTTSTGENAQHLGVPIPPLEAENSQLVAADWQGDKQEMEDNLVDINATKNVNNQFEGLDMHWPPSVGPWQFIASSSQQVISTDSSSLNGFASTSLGIF